MRIRIKHTKKRRAAGKKPARAGRWIKIGLVLVLIPAVVMGWFLVRYYFIFDAIIEKKLDLEAFGAATEIYSAQTVLSPGQQMPRQALMSDLRRLGYEDRGRVGGAGGAYYQSLEDARLLVHNDAHRLEDSSRTVEVVFSSDNIQSILDVGNREDLERFALKPQLLSNLITGDREKRRFVPYEELPAVLVNAVLAAEDRRFFAHSGVDPIRILRALLVDIRVGEAKQGASTLTQQFVKNYFLTPERTLKRKLTDAYMSILLERRLSKQQIFELWANEVYLGQRGSFGIIGFGEAAEAFFNKRIGDVTVGEAALLAGIIPAPNRYAPLRHPERARSRRDLVLDRMAEFGMLSPSQRDAAKAEPPEIKSSAVLNYSDAPYFVDYLQEYMDEHMGPDEVLSRSHHKVYTTLDVNLQKAAYEAMREGLTEVDATLAKSSRDLPPGTVQASLIAVDPRTGHILAMIGGRNYGTSQFNRITQSKRQPGSIFKPVVYAAALESAYSSATPLTPISPVLDAPAHFQFEDQLYEPRNFQEEYLGQVTMRQAVSRSLNIATIKFAETIGLDRVAEMAHRLGLNEQIQPFPAMAIGAFEVTPLEMVRAYTSFANGGLRTDLLPVTAVFDDSGNQVFRGEAKSEQVISPQVAFMITSLLESVINEGTGAAARTRGFRLPAAGKTGTSRDGWFAGYTPDMLCIAWVGLDDNRELNLQGSRSALPIWAAFMKRAAVIRPLKGESFAVPEGVVRVEIDPTTGYLATERCPYRQMEYFIKGTEPVLPCYGSNYEHSLGSVPTSIYSTPKESPAGADKNNAPPETKKPTR
jgi:penicillin-binding protein 1B